MIPPFWFLEGFGLVWRLAMLTPATMTVRAPGRTSCTRPRLPRSVPVMTITSSPLRSRMPAISKHLRRERDDLHEVPLAELACDGSEDACPAGLVLRVEQNGGVIVEADHRPVGAAILLRLADHDRAHYLALLHTGVRDRVLHCRDEHITDLRRRTRRRAQHADHRELTRSGVVGATDPGVRPDHSSACSSSCCACFSSRSGARISATPSASSRAFSMSATRGAAAPASRARELTSTSRQRFVALKGRRSCIRTTSP